MTEPICNGCFDGSPPSRCTKPALACPHHAICARCKKGTSGRMIVAGMRPPRRRPQPRATALVRELS